jgi:hypothetical protein
MTQTISSADRRLSLSPIGFRLIDDLTLAAPVGFVGCELFAGDGAGGWAPADLRARRSAGAVLIFPNLGRTARRGLGGAPTRTYQARFTAEFYTWYGQRTADGYEFPVAPFNDAEPPPGLTGLPVPITLVPAPNYPFPTELRVLHGIVQGPDGPVPNAEVSRANIDVVLTDARGQFALALRQPPLAGQVTLDATDYRTQPHRVGHLAIQLPDALQTSQTIDIN